MSHFDPVITKIKERKSGIIFEHCKKYVSAILDQFHYEVFILEGSVSTEEPWN